MLIVIAQENEIELVKEAGYLGTAPILITGPGIANVINALKNIPRSEYIINIGYAGSNNIKVGEWVDINDCRFHHEKATFWELSKRLQTKGVPCYTSTDFVTETTLKQDCVFDMELAAICNMGFDKVRAMKKISDNLNYKEYKKVEGKK